MIGKQQPTKEISEELEFVKKYFDKHPGRTPVNINRVYSDPMFNKKELHLLYSLIKQDTLNDHITDSSIISHVLSNEKNLNYPLVRSDDEMKVFFTAIQWVGTNVGSEIIGSNEWK